MARIKKEDLIVKWFKAFRGILDRQEIELAVLDQTDLFHLINSRMSPEDKVSYADLNKFIDEEYINKLGKVPEYIKKEWNKYFSELNAYWKVTITKKSTEDSQPYKYHWIAERSFPRFVKSLKKIEGVDKVALIEVDSEEQRELIQSILDGNI